MYHYLICNNHNDEIFKKQCNALEKNIKGLKKIDTLEDVDGSIEQTYLLNNKKIKVINCCYIDEVCVDSEIDLEPFFKK